MTTTRHLQRGLGACLLMCVACGGSPSRPSTTVSSVSVAGSPTITRGQTSQFTAMATLTNGSNQDVTSAATWTSSDNAVAAVNAAGLVSAVAEGTIDITATYQKVPGKRSVQVTSAVVITSIAVDGSTSLTSPGQTSQLSATARYSDGSNQAVTSQATWSSADGSVASVNGAGIVTAVTNGAAEVSATYQGVTGSRTVEVRTSACAPGGHQFNAGVGSGAYEALSGQGCQTCHKAGAKYDFTGGAQQAYNTALLLVQPLNPNASKLLSVARAQARPANHQSASVWPVDQCYPGIWCGEAIQKWIEEGACAPK